MEFRRLLEIVGDEPVFETGLLLAGDVDPVNVQRQLSRWTKTGRLYQLRRGVYALAPPFQQTKPHPFVVANYMIRASYVSAQSALAYYGLIPEYTPTVTSVTTARPTAWETPLGRFQFRHIKADLWFGFHLVEVARAQQAFLAWPEKALLDLVYLEPGGDSPEYLSELRLQLLETLDVVRLRKIATRSGIPKLIRAADRIADMALQEEAEYETL